MTREKIIGAILAGCIAIWWFNGIRTESEMRERFGAAIIAKDSRELNKVLRINKTSIDPSTDNAMLHVVLKDGDNYATRRVLTKESVQELEQMDAFQFATDNIFAFERLIEIGVDPAKSLGGGEHVWIRARIIEVRDPSFINALKTATALDTQTKWESAYADFQERSARADAKRAAAPDCSSIRRAAEQLGYGFIERGVAISELKRRGDCK